jgi:hypothetical protein
MSGQYMAGLLTLGVQDRLVHRLGTVCAVVMAMWWSARTLARVRRARRLRRRLDEVLLRGPVSRRPYGARLRGTARRWLPLVGAVCGTWVLVGGIGGLLLGLLVGAALRWWRLRHERGTGAGSRAGEKAADDALAARRFPLAADLLAACIAAGATPVTAARAVGEALTGPVGERLATGAAEVRLGGEPAAAWRGLAELPGAAPLARLLERAGDSGAPAAVPVARLAADARAERGRAATARARRAGVLITLPLGLCFLPAFLVVGVLPVVIGLAGGMVDGGGA